MGAHADARNTEGAQGEASDPVEARFGTLPGTPNGCALPHGVWDAKRARRWRASGANLGEIC